MKFRISNYVLFFISTNKMYVWLNNNVFLFIDINFYFSNI